MYNLLKIASSEYFRKNKLQKGKGYEGGTKKVRIIAMVSTQCKPNERIESSNPKNLSHFSMEIEIFKEKLTPCNFEPKKKRVYFY